MTALLMQSKCQYCSVHATVEPQLGSIPSHPFQQETLVAGVQNTDCWRLHFCLNCSSQLELQCIHISLNMIAQKGYVRASWNQAPSTAAATRWSVYIITDFMLKKTITAFFGVLFLCMIQGSHHLG